MAKSNEPIWWSLFSAGGVVAAFFLPITMILTGFAVPAELISENGLYDLLHHWLTRVYLFLMISLPLFHWAHRFRFAVADLGLKDKSGMLPVAVYLAAIVGTILALVFLIRL